MPGIDFLRIDTEHSWRRDGSLENMIRGATITDVVPIIRCRPRRSVRRPQGAGMRGGGNRGAAHPLGRGRQGRRRGGEVPAARQARFRAAVPVRRMGGRARATSGREWSDAETLVGVMVENVKVLDCIDDIMALDGVDFVLFGPADYAISAGLKGPDHTHPVVREGLQRTCDAARKVGKHVMYGVGTDDAEAKLAAEMGCHHAGIQPRRGDFPLGPGRQDAPIRQPGGVDKLGPFDQSRLPAPTKGVYWGEPDGELAGPVFSSPAFRRMRRNTGRSAMDDTATAHHAWDRRWTSDEGRADWLRPRGSGRRLGRDGAGTGRRAGARSGVRRRPSYPGARPTGICRGRDRRLGKRCRLCPRAGDARGIGGRFPRRSDDRPALRRRRVRLRVGLERHLPRRRRGGPPMPRRNPACLAAGRPLSGHHAVEAQRQFRPRPRGRARYLRRRRGRRKRRIRISIATPPNCSICLVDSSRGSSRTWISSGPAPSTGTS